MKTSFPLACQCNVCLTCRHPLLRPLHAPQLQPPTARLLRCTARLNLRRPDPRLDQKGGHRCVPLCSTLLCGTQFQGLLIRYLGRHTGHCARTAVLATRTAIGHKSTSATKTGVPGPCALAAALAALTPVGAPHPQQLMQASRSSRSVLRGRIPVSPCMPHVPQHPRNATLLQRPAYGLGSHEWQTSSSLFPPSTPQAVS